MNVFDFIAEHPIMAGFIVLMISEVLVNFARAWAIRKTG